MNEHADSTTSIVEVTIVEDDVSFTLDALCRACQVDRVQLIALVHEGVLDPGGGAPEDWQFSGDALRRARSALRLSRDLDLGVAGTALVLDLLDEIESLKSRLRRGGLA